MTRDEAIDFIIETIWETATSSEEERLIEALDALGEYKHAQRLRDDIKQRQDDYWQEYFDNRAETMKDSGIY
jgi:dissimilatory sulfite reductase (desulfoviridin) alpha/beta subunit